MVETVVGMYLQYIHERLYVTGLYRCKINFRRQKLTQKSENTEDSFLMHIFLLACVSYCPFKKYVEYIFSPGCLSMMSRSILRL